MDTSLIPNIELFIATLFPFNQLPSSLVQRIASQIMIRYIPKGEAVIDEQSAVDFLYIIRIGEVEQIHQDGELRAKLEQGDIFGFSIFSPHEKEKYCAYALENSLIYQIPYPCLSKILQEYPEYAAYFSPRTSTRLISIARSANLKNDDNIFMKKAIEVANPKVALVDVNSTIQQTAQEMQKQRRSSALVLENGKLIGIVNDRDMTKKVVAMGLDIHQSIRQIMAPNPPTIAPSDLILDAVSLMMQHNIRSLPIVIDRQILGILTATDLVRYNSIQSIFIINRIFQANTLPLLIEVAQQQKTLFIALMQNGTSYNTIMKVMTLIADAFNRKLLMMAEHQFGEPPCAYAWVVSGSQARYEMHLLSDQDNFIITERSLNETEQAYFAQLAEFVNQGLDLCGYAYCSGNFMASNPKWCISLTQWKENFNQWVRTPELESLLNTSVLMDMRALYGETNLVEQLQDHITELVKNNKRFLSFLVANSTKITPPLSIFRNFVLIKEGENKNKLNLKKRAISLLVDLGRIYALAAGISNALSTEQRFIRCQELALIDKTTLDNALGAYECVCDIRFKYQRISLQNQQPISNHIDPSELTTFERQHLKDVFRLIAQFQEAAQLRFSQRGMMR